MPTYAERKAKHELRMARKERGVCRECDDPRGTNQDGTQSLFCDKHRAVHSRARATDTPKHKQTLRSLKARPSVRYDEDGFATTYIDTREFAEYAVTVAMAIRRIGRASIADLRRELGDAFDERYIFDALERLEGAGEVRHVFGLISRWAMATEAAKQLRRSQWNGTPKTPSVPRPDDAALFGNRRVTA